jgi:hypothetical protein
MATLQLIKSGRSSLSCNGQCLDENGLPPKNPDLSAPNSIGPFMTDTLIFKTISSKNQTVKQNIALNAISEISARSLDFFKKEFSPMKIVFIQTSLLYWKISQCNDFLLDSIIFGFYLYHLPALPEIIGRIVDWSSHKIRVSFYRHQA